MSLDLAFDDGQLAIADAVAHFCADRFDDDAVKAAAGQLPRAVWETLADLGVLGVLAPESDGGLLEAVAAIESLGRAVFPGPLAATVLASWVLDEPERSRVVAGRAIVCAGSGKLWPWAVSCEGEGAGEDKQDARVVLDIDVTGQPGPSQERVFLARFNDPLVPIETLGGEPWGRGSVERIRQLERGGDGLVVYRTALAAQIAAMGARLVDDASRHAAVRKQFGRPIGDFQAVAHPLADCSMRLAAAGSLAHAAAFHWDEGAVARAGHFAAAAHLSASEAGLEAASVCHQVFGAIGITLEGPVFHVSRRIRQLVSLAPGRAASRLRMTPWESRA